MKTPKTAIFSNLPICHLELFRSTMKKMGIKTKCRYRGPRNTQQDFVLGRSRFNRQSNCLKENAITFSVYDTGL